MPKDKPFWSTTELPWGPCETWKPGDWYPCAIGYMARDQKEYIVDGYLIYKQDEEDPRDMDVVPGECPALSFTTALAICELHNGRKMIDG